MTIEKAAKYIEITKKHQFAHRLYKYADLTNISEILKVLQASQSFDKT